VCVCVCECVKQTFTSPKSLVPHVKPYLSIYIFFCTCFVSSRSVVEMFQVLASWLLNNILFCFVFFLICVFTYKMENCFVLGKEIFQHENKLDIVEV
jgi:hypothetical protein